MSSNQYKPPSQKKIEANRKNALQSTGPKSTRGKNVSASNSLKHGLLAKSAVIIVGPAKESEAEFETLLWGLRDYFDPVGTAEELLVEEIAVSYWKERRAHLYENRQIQDQIRTATRGDLLKEVDYDGGLADLLVSALGDTRQLLTSLQGLEYLLGMLGEIREEVDNAGEASGDSLNRLSRFLGGDWKSVVGKSEMLAEMDREKHRLEGFKKMIKQREEEDRTARVHRALLVGPETMEQLLRYTAAIEKRRYRALVQLERLQRQRSGDAIPPPLQVHISSEVEDCAKRSQ